MNPAALWAGTYFDGWDDLGPIFGCSWDEWRPHESDWRSESYDFN